MLKRIVLLLFISSQASAVFLVTKTDVCQSLLESIAKPLVIKADGAKEVSDQSVRDLESFSNYILHSHEVVKPEIKSSMIEVEASHLSSAAEVGQVAQRIQGVLQSQKKSVKDQGLKLVAYTFKGKEVDSFFGEVDFGVKYLALLNAKFNEIDNKSLLKSNFVTTGSLGLFMMLELMSGLFANEFHPISYIPVGLMAYFAHARFNGLALAKEFFFLSDLKHRRKIGRLKEFMLRNSERDDWYYATIEEQMHIGSLDSILKCGVACSDENVKLNSYNKSSEYSRTQELKKHNENSDLRNFLKKIGDKGWVGYDFLYRAENEKGEKTLTIVARISKKRPVATNPLANKKKSKKSQGQLLSGQMPESL